LDKKIYLAQLGFA